MIICRRHHPYRETFVQCDHVVLNAELGEAEQEDVAFKQVLSHHHIHLFLNRHYSLSSMLHVFCLYPDFL